MKRAFCGVVLFAVFAALPAKAGLTACNRTSYVIYAAGAALKGSDFTLKGWTRILPGGCAEVLAGDLTGDAYYITARSSRAHSGAARAWSGPTNLCAKDKDFSLRQSFGTRCPADGLEMGYAQIDTHHMRNTTTTFRETPDFRSMDAAKQAGLRRLFADIGQHDTATDKKLGEAVTALRTRMRIVTKAPDTAVFDALETEALKRGGNAGYTLCNDTGTSVYAAIGLQKSGAFVSRGWWTVGSGSCSPLITDPIQGQKIWLRVERGKGPPLVGGPNGFCVTNIEFDIQGRENCKKRGLQDAGFAETNQKGAAGFTARVTAQGLTGQ
jgi:uncharacterized membrane protein